MLRFLNALFLSLTLALTGYSMAVARGQSNDITSQMVICTGVGIITISIDADGNPVETTHICPDAMSIFAAQFSILEIAVAANTMQWRISFQNSHSFLSAETLTPQARGPPLTA